MQVQAKERDAATILWLESWDQHQLKSQDNVMLQETVFSSVFKWFKVNDQEI